MEVVFGGRSGYIADDSDGQDTATAALPMVTTGDGVWGSDEPEFERFVDRRYSYRVTRGDGSINWATDMFSRQQVGTGDIDPRGPATAARQTSSTGVRAAQ
ncbi:MAG: hypothetical protein ACRDRX_01385 [Pseudonocardiaceae bacterium]